LEKTGKIGVFDSGFGGLTVLREIASALPQYNYIYFGDNARSPYGNKSFDLIYEYTLEGVEFLFKLGCELVILACNTASAKALRTIQQTILPIRYPNKRVLGVIRPCAEDIQWHTRTNKVGILGTEGTVNSSSYLLELAKISPKIEVFQQACPLWVPLIEERQYNSPAGKMIIASDIEHLFAKDPEIDTLILACTHYPIIRSMLEEIVNNRAKIMEQGPLVAVKLRDYLKRHMAIEESLKKDFKLEFYSTEREDYFNEYATEIFGAPVYVKQIHLT